MGLVSFVLASPLLDRICLAVAFVPRETISYGLSYVVPRGTLGLSAKEY